MQYCIRIGDDDFERRVLLLCSATANVAGWMILEWLCATATATGCGGGECGERCKDKEVFDVHFDADMVVLYANKRQCEEVLGRLCYTMSASASEL